MMAMQMMVYVTCGIIQYLLQLHLNNRSTSLIYWNMKWNDFFFYFSKKNVLIQLTIEIGGQKWNETNESYNYLDAIDDDCWTGDELISFRCSNGIGLDGELRLISAEGQRRLRFEKCRDADDWDVWIVCCSIKKIGPTTIKFENLVIIY